jgi:membrane protein
MSIPSRIKSWTRSAFLTLKETAVNFDNNHDLKYCASLSFYTIFSVAPMLIMAISIGSVLYGNDAVKGHLFGQINSLVGNETALEIQNIISHTTLKKNTTVATVIGFIFFFIGTTGVFVEIQSTINKIWGLKARPRKGFIKYVVNRVLSFAMVISVGFMMVVSLIASTVIEMLNERLNRFLPDTTFIINTVNHVVSLTLIALFFALIFKYLPDSIVKWKDAIVGSLFTSFLFLLGKYLIGLYMAKATAIDAYGAAGSVVVLLLWIYYSSILLYFGAEFTKVYALKHGHGIKPNNYSVRIEYIENEILTRRDKELLEGTNQD